MSDAVAVLVILLWLVVIPVGLVLLVARDPDGKAQRAYEKRARAEFLKRQEAEVAAIKARVAARSEHQ
ncbi:MAG TPA: hypothetical protein VFG73_10895 [Rhodanobacteraceae bacterium]|nr:hypothetical protein [Rhodanobacteraceae bacterium]